MNVNINTIHNEDRMIVFDTRFKNYSRRHQGYIYPLADAENR